MSVPYGLLRLVIAVGEVSVSFTYCCLRLRRQTWCICESVWEKSECENRKRRKRGGEGILLARMPSRSQVTRWGANSLFCGVRHRFVFFFSSCSAGPLLSLLSLPLSHRNNEPSTNPQPTTPHALAHLHTYHTLAKMMLGNQPQPKDIEVTPSLMHTPTYGRVLSR